MDAREQLLLRVVRGLGNEAVAALGRTTVAVGFDDGRLVVVGVSFVAVRGVAAGALR